MKQQLFGLCDVSSWFAPLMFLESECPGIRVIDNISNIREATRGISDSILTSNCGTVE